MTNRWENYHCYVDDLPASVLVDLGAKDLAPDAERPVALSVWIPLLQPEADGQAGAAEAKELFYLEDTLNGAMNVRLDAKLVGMVTTQGRRELYYYAPDAAGFEETIASALAPFPEYRAELDTRDDPGWQCYRDLLNPSPGDLQRIESRRLIGELRRRGDDLDTARPIVHSAHFRTRAGRDTFVALIVPRGFSLIEGGLTEDAGHDRPFGIRFQILDTPTEEAIHEVTDLLIALCRNHDGTYESWETQPVHMASSGRKGGLLRRFRRL